MEYRVSYAQKASEANAHHGQAEAWQLGPHPIAPKSMKSHQGNQDQSGFPSQSSAKHSRHVRRVPERPTYDAAMHSQSLSILSGDRSLILFIRPKTISSSPPINSSMYFLNNKQ